MEASKQKRIEERKAFADYRNKRGDIPPELRMNLITTTDWSYTDYDDGDKFTFVAIKLPTKAQMGVEGSRQYIHKYSLLKLIAEKHSLSVNSYGNELLQVDGREEADMERLINGAIEYHQISHSEEFGKITEKYDKQLREELSTLLREV